jgi:hypothetical protein
MHLNIEELVDIAEGERNESEAPHLLACERCREQVRDLRASIAAARDVEVPEPSPLFWDHLSSRVSEAVAAEGVPAGRGWLKPSRAVLATLGVAAALLIVVTSSSRPPVTPAVALPSVPVADTKATTDLLSDLIGDDDGSLRLVASLTDDQDLETVREAGLAPRGSADHAVAHLSDDELRELGRLLREELARSGG